MSGTRASALTSAKRSPAASLNPNPRTGSTGVANTKSSGPSTGRLSNSVWTQFCTPAA